MKVVKPFVPAALAAALLGAAQGSPVSYGCSSDTFTVDGTALGVGICARPQAAPAGSPLVFTETLTVKGQPPLVRDLKVDTVAGEPSPHVIDDVPLAKLGIAKTLHIALSYRAGAVRLEHALLVPGAISLK
jgi:hypothetical protein